jgi:hypothetical protein
MKLLRRCDHVLQAAHFANALRASGIACEVRNTTLAGAIGDIPWLECAPQVWIHDALDEPRALALLQELSQPPGDAPAWHCAKCDETIEAQFGACWNCGALRRS